MPANNSTKKVIPKEVGLKKKKSTKPWEEKSRRWTPDIYKLATDHKGFHARFVDVNKVSRRLHEGYVIANGADWGEEEGKYQIKDSVLMELPLELVKERQDYMEEKINRGRRTAADLAKEAAATLGRASGEDNLLDIKHTI